MLKNYLPKKFINYQKLNLWLIAPLFLFSFIQENRAFGMENSSKNEIETIENAKEEMNFFWGKKNPWHERGPLAEDSVICKKSKFYEKKINDEFSLLAYDYTFYSPMYFPGAQYLKEKVFLRNKKTKKEILLKSFEEKEDKFFAVYAHDDKLEIIEKN